MTFNKQYDTVVINNNQSHTWIGFDYTTNIVNNTVDNYYFDYTKDIIEFSTSNSTAINN